MPTRSLPNVPAGAVPSTELRATALAAGAVPSPATVAAGLIRDARRARGMTQDELGRRAGVPRQVVELWEDPTWEGHSLSTLHRAARALGARLEMRIAPLRARQSRRAPRESGAAIERPRASAAGAHMPAA